MDWTSAMTDDMGTQKTCAEKKRHHNEVCGGDQGSSISLRPWPPTMLGPKCLLIIIIIIIFSAAVFDIVVNRVTR